MAFDQNTIPNNLRPINIARTLAVEPRITPVTLAPNPSRDVGSPGSIPVYYPAPVPDSGFAALGFGNNAVPAVSNWLPRVPPPVVGAASGVNPTSAFAYNPSYPLRIDPTIAMRIGGGPASDHASDDGGDDSVSGKKVKFLCSFGGKILPRPSDGALRYVGGHTRIISVRRDLGFNGLVQKMADTYGQNVVIKYQLPDEDLDALVSVSGPDDLENMMDEYDKLVERSSDGSAKLRVFLFSASELDSSGVLRLGEFQDSGQRYVEAVNGIVDGFVSGIVRKESIASATSTQNSELSGTEAVDSTGHEQGEVTGPSSTGRLSPRGNYALSQDIARRLVSGEPTPVVHVEASGAPFSIPVGNAVPPPALSAQSEHELERSVPVPVQPQQLGYDLQQPAVTFPPPASYMQAYVDPRLEPLNRAEHVQLPSQMGFPAQLLGTVGPVYTQHQFHDNAIGVSPHQFIPAVHMTMNPSARVSFKPNAVHPLVPQQVRLEHYPEESTYGQRVVQLSGDPSYNAYQAQVPPPVAGGPYGWNQAAHPEQVAFSEGRMPHQHVIVSDTVPRLEGCYMCQKALPHAHSDTLAQGHTENAATMVHDLNSVYQSLQLEDNVRGMQLNRVAAARPLGEGVVEKQGAGVRARVLGHNDHEAGKPQLEGVGSSQAGDMKSHNDRNIAQVDFPGAIQSPYGAFVSPAPHLGQENVVQHFVVTTQYQVKPETLISKPAISDISSVGSTPSVASDHLVHESPKDYPGKLPAIVPREEAMESCFTYDNLRKIDGRMEDLRIRPHEVFHNNERSSLPVIGNPSSKPQMVLDANDVKQSEMLPSSSEVQHLHGFPMESHEMAQQPLFSGPFSGPDYPYSSLAMNNLAADDVSCRHPAFSGVDQALMTDGEWKDHSSQFEAFEPKLIPGELDSLSQYNLVVETQDSSNSLFSNQDPWKLRHDTHFPPPRPNKILTKKETLGTKDAFGDNRVGNSGESPTGNNGGLATETRLDNGVYQPYANLDMDFNLEHGRSSKGSAEELIKQELQAVAEGVAASVLQSSLPSNPDLSGHGRSGYSSDTNQNGEAQYSDADVGHSDKFEDVKVKLHEKENFGFPVSDGLGRLQIIRNCDLEELRELGSGTFGTVYHGKWRGSDVAIKRINDRCFAGKASEQERMREDFWNEAIKLADLHHPNVVAFYGVVLDGPGGAVATVTEYMVNGSLRTALQKNERSLDKRKRLLIAMDVAFGMEYLHGKNIVHFDLKSDNLLVNLRDPHRPICKVGDLGLSKVKCQTLISGGVRGTLPWMAPELLNGSSSLVSEKVDVFSFGIVLWELLTGDEPYADLHYGAIIGGIVSNTLRPPVPESCDPEWRSLMERCWSAETSERPNFTEIASHLRTMAAKVPTKAAQQQ